MKSLIVIIYLFLPFSKVYSASDRPKPWEENIPTEFSDKFEFGQSIDDVSKKPLENTLIIKSKKSDDPMPIDVTVLKQKLAFSYNNEKPPKLEWATYVNPSGLTAGDHCISVLSKPVQKNGTLVQNYTSYFVSNDHPENNRVLHCEMQNEGSLIKLNGCLEYSKYSCSSWNRYFEKSKVKYDSIKIRNCNLNDIDCLQTVQETRRKMSFYLRPTEDRDFKQNIMSITRGETKIRWEPKIQISPTPTRGPGKDISELNMQEEICKKYETFFMTDGERKAHESAKGTARVKKLSAGK